MEVPDDDPNIPVIEYKIVRYLTPTLGKPSQLIARYNFEKIYNRGKNHKLIFECMYVCSCYLALNYDGVPKIP